MPRARIRKRKSTKVALTSRQLGVAVQSNSPEGKAERTAQLNETVDKLPKLLYR